MIFDFVTPQRWLQNKYNYVKGKILVYIHYVHIVIYKQCGKWKEKKVVSEIVNRKYLENILMWSANNGCNKCIYTEWCYCITCLNYLFHLSSLHPSPPCTSQATFDKSKEVLGFPFLAIADEKIR